MIHKFPRTAIPALAILTGAVAVGLLFLPAAFAQNGTTQMCYMNHVITVPNYLVAYYTSKNASTNLAGCGMVTAGGGGG